MSPTRLSQQQILIGGEAERVFVLDETALGYGLYCRLQLHTIVGRIVNQQHFNAEIFRLLHD